MKKDTENNKFKQPIVLMATVKGDVHDIGKNIVSVVMQCNNIYLNYLVEGEADINRDTRYNIKLVQEKMKTNSWSKDYVRFRWDRIMLNKQYWKFYRLLLAWPKRQVLMLLKIFSK